MAETKKNGDRSDYCERDRNREMEMEHINNANPSQGSASSASAVADREEDEGTEERKSPKVGSDEERRTAVSRTREWSSDSFSNCFRWQKGSGSSQDSVISRTPIIRGRTKLDRAELQRRAGVDTARRGL